jgi:hypothetical protein
VPKQGSAMILIGLNRPLTGRDAKVEIEGEDYDGQSGVTREESGDTSMGQSISAAANGWVYFENVDYTDQGVDSADLRVKAAADTSVELRAESETGTLLGKCEVSSTSNAWATRTCKLNPPVTGVSKLYVLFAGAAHLNWLKFSGTGTPGTGGTSGSPDAGAGGSTGTGGASGGGGAKGGTGGGGAGGLATTTSSGSAGRGGSVSGTGAGGSVTSSSDSARAGGSVTISSDSARGGSSGGNASSKSAGGSSQSSSAGASSRSSSASGTSAGCGCRLGSTSREPQGALLVLGSLLSALLLYRRRR